MFKENDLAQLTAHILHLSKEAVARQQLGKAAREKTEKRYSLENYKTAIQNQIKICVRRNASKLRKSMSW